MKLKKILHCVRNIQFIICYILYPLRRKINSIEDYNENEVRVIIKNNKIDLDGSDTDEIPKIIWTYWDDAEKPTYVTKILLEVQNLNPDHEVRILDPVTIKNYLPDELNITGEMPVANKSDIIRLLLLKKYGGIWIDSTILVSDGFTWVHHLKGNDLIAFYREKSTLDFNFPVIESWFLCSPANNKFITAWLEELLPLSYLGSKEYFKKISSREDYDIIKQNINSPEYLLVYLAQQIAMRRFDNLNFNLICCEDSALYYQERSGWDTISNSLTLMHMPLPMYLPKIIKLTGMDRRFFALATRIGLIKKNSILGSFLSKT